MLSGALIGCGYIAPRHGTAWNKQTEAKLVSVVDIDEDRARSFAEVHGVPNAVRTFDELLEERGNELDFVDICLPPELHEPMLARALDAGLHVLCQKPMSDTLAGTRRMVEAADRSALTVGITEIWKWFPAYEHVGELLVDGAVGPVEQVTFRGCSNLLLPRTGGEPVSDTYARFSTMERLVVLEYGVHILDLMRSWFGEPVRLSARTARSHPGLRGDDAARIRLTYRTLEIDIELDFSAPGPATLDNLVGESLAVRGREGLIISESARTVELYAGSVEPQRWAHPADQRDAGFEACQRDFVDAVAQGRAPASHLADNVRSTALVLASYHSADAGGEWVENPSEFWVDTAD